MRWPRIAVVIATYGRTDTLRLAVESALRQTYPSLQLVIVVDGNPEQHAQLREIYAGESRITLHNLTRNSGEQSGPSNLGVALTDAELIAFLNHDDLWFPDHLAILAEMLLARGADIAFSQAAGVFPREGIARAQDCDFYLMSRLPGGRYRPAFSWVGVSNVLVRREQFEALRGFRAARDCLLESSQDFLARAVRGGARIAYADRITSFAVHSGLRPGSYLPGYDPREQKVLSAWLAKADAEAVRMDVAQRLAADDHHRAADLFVRLTGFPVRLFAYRLHGFRRGGLINRLRATRGLPPMRPPALTVGDFRDQARLARLTRVEGDRTFGPHDLGQVLGEGWHVIEAWGSWSARRTATLRFAVAAPADTMMELQLACMLPGGILQRLDVRAGETRVRRWYRLREMTPLTIALRAPVPPGGTVTVRLSTPWLRRAGKRFGGDARRIGVGLGGLSIRFAAP